MVVRSKFVPVFCLFVCFICIFWNYYRNIFNLKKFLMILSYIKKASVKMLYLKNYKWLLSKNQRVRNDSFGYRQ